MMFEINRIRARVVVVTLTVLTAVVNITAIPNSAEAGWWNEYVTDPIVSGWQSVSERFGSSDDVVPDTDDEELPGYLAQNWSRLTGQLAETLNLRDNHENLQDSRWFGYDKRSNTKEINKLMDAALEILVNCQATDLRWEAEALRVRNLELRAEADQLRNDRITAPTETDWKQPWKLSKAKIDERLGDIDREIKDNSARLVAVNAELVDALRALGLELDQAQVDVLLNSVTGDDLLENAAVFANVKIVVAKLEELTRNDQNNLEINRRYAGMYLVLNDILIYTQREVVREIEETYKPQLARIRQEADNLRRDAEFRSRHSQYTQAQKDTFVHNAETNAMTIKVADLYVQLLDKQRKGLLDNISRLQLNHDAAENTYRTVKNSGELRSVIQSGLNLFDSIQDISVMPELQNFISSDVMRTEFDEINRRLKSSD